MSMSGSQNNIWEDTSNPSFDIEAITINVNKCHNLNNIQFTLLVYFIFRRKIINITYLVGKHR